MTRKEAMAKKNFRRMTLDDLIPSDRNEGHFQIIQDKKTGKPKLKKKKVPGSITGSHREQYPTFFRLISDNPSIPDPVEEFKFHPVRRWRIDLCWPDQKLALEIEGGVFTNGRHVRPIGFIKDLEKYNALSILGYSLLRFTPQQMKSCESYDYLREWFKNNTGDIKCPINQKQQTNLK